MTSYDPSSPAYKKALKQHLKSTSNNPKSNPEWSAFRIEEKKYKARFPRPTMDDVLDLQPYSSKLELAGWAPGRTDVVKVKEISLNAEHTTKAVIVPQIPGLVILPAFVSHDEQRDLIHSSLRDQARNPNETNLDAHYNIPDEGVWTVWENHWHDKRHDPAATEIQVYPKAGASPTTSAQPSSPPSTESRRTLVDNVAASITMLATLIATPKPPPEPSSTLTPIPISEALLKMRWANIGRSYHWGTKSYDFEKQLGRFPEDVRQICKRAVRAVDWKDIWGGADQAHGDWGDEGEDWDTWHDSYEPDAGIVNFYQTKDTLMGHVDRSELSSTTPLVSISLGNSAIFLIGGLTRDIKPLPILLHSGDVVIMSGPSCRRAYHGVPRILEGTLPSHLRSTTDPSVPHPSWEPFAEYMNATRININVRQVFPRGFELPPSVARSNTP